MVAGRWWLPLHLQARVPGSRSCPLLEALAPCFLFGAKQRGALWLDHGDGAETTEDLPAWGGSSGETEAQRPEGAAMAKGLRVCSRSTPWQGRPLDSGRVPAHHCHCGLSVGSDNPP